MRLKLCFAVVWYGSPRSPSPRHLTQRHWIPLWPHLFPGSLSSLCVAGEVFFLLFLFHIKGCESYGYCFWLLYKSSRYGWLIFKKVIFTFFKQKGTGLRDIAWLVYTHRLTIYRKIVVLFPLLCVHFLWVLCFVRLFRFQFSSKSKQPDTSVPDKVLI
jgi:hypothetical protein